jgi:hypothetical protein
MPSAKHTAVNVSSGAAVGLHALHFTNPETLRRELVALGMLE